MLARKYKNFLGAWFFKYRGGIWTLFFVGVFFLAHPGISSFLWGIPFVFLGQALRFWAAGSISRYRGESVQAEQLVTWGPFGWIRNPLYLGNGLIGLGWTLMARNAFILVLYGLVFLCLYPGIIIPHEERFLQDLFGTAYLRSKEKTPPLFPRRLFQKEDFRGPFNVEILWKSERHSLYVTVLGTLLFLGKALNG